MLFKYAISFILFVSIANVAYSEVKDDKGKHKWINIFPIGTEIHGLAIDPQNVDTIYASTYRGFFKSVDGGKLWLPLRQLLEVESSIISIDPTSSKTLYWSWKTKKEIGFWRSKDGGSKWEDISAGVIKDKIDSIAINPKKPEIMYVISGGRLYKTLNGGKTWGEIGGKARWLYLNTDLPDELYVCCETQETRDGAVFYMLKHSINGGQSFELVTPYTFDSEGKKTKCGWWYMAFSNNEILVACKPGGEWEWATDIIKSSDGGKTWELIAVKPFVKYIGEKGRDRVFGNEIVYRNGEIKWVKLHPTDKNVIYSGIEVWEDGDNLKFRVRGKVNKILKSTDGGKTWMPLPLPSPYLDIDYLEIFHPNSIYIATYHGIYKSVDEGANWKSASFGLPVKMYEKYLGEGIDLTGLKWVDTAGTIYVGHIGTKGDGYWSSNDNGASWNWSGEKDFRQIIITNNQTTYILSNVLKKATHNQESTEIKISILPLYLAVSPSNSQILYAVGDDNSHPRMYTTESFGTVFLKSEDGGFSWTKIDWQRWVQIREQNIWHDITLLSADPKSPNTLFAVVRHEARGLGASPPSREFSLLKTTDGGNTWVNISDGLYRSITSSLESVWSSSKWLNPKERPDIAKMLISSPKSVVIDPANSNIVYITTSAGGVYRSDDGGKNWKLKSPLDYLKTLIDAFDNLSAQQCKGRKGCKVMLDITLQKKGKGQIFIQAPPNTVIIYPQKILKERGFSFNNISINPSNPGTIYLATGNGVYRSFDRGERWELLNHGLLEPAVRKVMVSPSLILAEGKSGIYRLSE